MPYTGWNYDAIEPIKVPNPEVLRAGVKHAEEHIEHWNQVSWCDIEDLDSDGNPVCGTTACLAGHILLAQGNTWEQINRMDISWRARQALGWIWNRDPEGWDSGWDSEDANRFEDLVFATISTHDGHRIAYTQKRLDEFKEHITKITGVTFDDEK